MGLSIANRTTAGLHFPPRPIGGTVARASAEEQPYLDNSVIRAMARWPNVPAVHGWLSLDARGRWCLRGDPVTHRGAIEFINRNYDCTDAGEWYFQNGPQRVFVDLDYTPWIFTLDGSSQLADHTGRRVTRLRGAHVDEDGNLLLVGERGIGLLCDRDLQPLCDALRLADGTPCSEEHVLRLMGGGAPMPSEPLYLEWCGDRLEVESLRREQVSTRFGFLPRPRAGGIDD